MPLSEREQRILEQLERELSTEDPKLATTMTEGPRASFGRVVIAIVGIVAGLLLLIFGVSQSLAVVGVVGFVVMVAAVVIASRPSKKNQLRVVDASGQLYAPTMKKSRKGSNGAKKPSGSGGSFTQRMEERWEKRQNGE
jgi:uncharacterized membrane protein YgcG